MFYVYSTNIWRMRKRGEKKGEKMWWEKMDEGSWHQTKANVDKGIRREWGRKNEKNDHCGRRGTGWRVTRLRPHLFLRLTNSSSHQSERRTRKDQQKQSSRDHIRPERRITHWQQPTASSTPHVTLSSPSTSSRHSFKPCVPLVFLIQCLLLQLTWLRHSLSNQYLLCVTSRQPQAQTLVVKRIQWKTWDVWGHIWENLE